MKIREANTLVNLGYMKLQHVKKVVRERMVRALNTHAKLPINHPKLGQIENKVRYLDNQLFEICSAIEIVKNTQGGYVPFVDKDNNPFTLLQNGEPVYLSLN